LIVAFDASFALRLAMYFSSRLVPNSATLTLPNAWRTFSVFHNGPIDYRDVERFQHRDDLGNLQ
jgi:hypothetical protein